MKLFTKEIERKLETVGVMASWLSAKSLTLC